MSSTSSTPKSPPYLVDGKTDAERYLEGCLDGSVVACEKIKKLARMMLPRFHEEYHGFHFDVEKSLRPVRFIESFCMIPSAENMGMPFIMEPYERMIVELAFGFVDEDGFRQFREVFVEISRKNGKALAVSQKLPTPNGWRKMGDLHVGDVVFGRDGKPSTVIAESEIFDKPMYLVTFEDGAEIRASEDHIWTVSDTTDMSHGYFDATTSELFSEFKPYRYNVPICGPVEYPPVAGLDDAYGFGLDVGSGKVDSIPREYMVASVEQRENLVRGILSATEQRNGGRLAFDDEALRDDVVELESSLGNLAVPYERDGEFSLWIAEGWHGKRIVSIEHIPNEPSKCIAIDNPSHLYLVGRHYTATHNTSLLAALNLYMLTSDGEPAAECYNGATNTQQARLCFGSTNDMVKMSPFLKKRIRRGMVQKRGISGLNYDRTNSYLCTISSRSDSLDGLNMHFGVLDELGACRDQGATYRLLMGAMSSRRQPMLISISTQNKVRNNIFDDKLAYCNKVLNGEVASDRVLPILFEQDNREEVFAGLDEEYRWLWRKSNPGLGTVKKEKEMLELVQQAFDNRADVPEVLMKQFNIPALEYQSFLEYEECVNMEPVPFDPEIDRYCCIGFDLASSGDLNAACAIYKRPGDDRFYERSCCWIAKEQVDINIKGFKERDAVPYRQWASDGWLHIVEGDKVNQLIIIEWIRSLIDEGLYPMAVAYDRWHVDDYTRRELARLVGESRVHEIPQYAKELSPLMKEHKIDLRSKRVINDSPVTHWARTNVECTVDNNDNYMPRKKNLDPHKKIDPYIAELMAFKAYKLHEEEYLAMLGETPEPLAGWDDD